MHRKAIAAIVLAGVILPKFDSAHGADLCPALQLQTRSADTATRIAAFACSENLLWYRPFIDASGRVASATVAEGETTLLGDGITQTWQRVAGYWRESGLLWQMGRFPG